MPVLTVRELYDIARGAGFGEREAVTWTAIALARSGGRTGEPGAPGGPWRITSLPGVDAGRWGDLDDPRTSARAAYEISRQGRDTAPWTTSPTGGAQSDFRAQLVTVQQTIGIAAPPLPAPSP